MKKIFAVLGIVTFAVVGCDDSSSASSNDDPGVESSSSSVTLQSSSSVRSSTSAPVENLSSSSEKSKSSSSKNEESSSSVKSSSSSSVIPGSGTESSSSVAESSSSVEESSSSVVTPQSSSSSTSVSSSSADVRSSSSETESSSSSSEVKLSSSSDGFDWNLPKETYLNPDIDYGTMTDERDGKVYKTVTIGDQIWMAENLNFDPGQGGSGDAKYDWSWCYGDEPKNCDVAGRIYTWAAAMDSVKLATDADDPQECGFGKICGLASASSATLVQGVCPTGWHLPTEAEWNSLFTAVGDESTAGKVLKSQTGWYNRGNGTDAFGFSALPAGGRNGDEDYYNEGDYAYFWSSTELNSSYAYRMYLDYGSVSATLSFFYKDYGFSVRCLKNN